MKKRLPILLLVIVVLVTLTGCTLFSNPFRRQPGDVQEKHRDQEGKGGTGGSGPVVLGFYTEKGPGEETDSSESLKNQFELMDEVAFFWYTYDANGTINVWGEPNWAMLNFAKEKGLRVYALIHNLKPEGFDAELARAVIARPDVRRRFIQNIKGVLTERGFDGVSVDIEAVPPEERDNYTTFIRELKDALGDMVVQISVPAKTWDDPNSSWSGGFDYRALGKVADQIVLMTYDEHGFGMTAGPIASINWITNVVNYATRNIPKEKILMGIPVYSFDWSSANPNIPEYLTHRQVMERVGRFNANVIFDRTAKVPRFTYRDENGNSHQVFFENAESASVKIDLARNRNLHGIAIWRLGMEDPKVWQVIAEKLK